MKKMLFIINPCAGTKRANRYMMQLLEIFSAAGYLVTTFITQGQGDALNAARELSGDMDLVVCCGGDGTFNETVSGILALGKQIPVGYIPAGSTNDFATSLELPLDVLEAAEHIVQGQPVQFDVGLFNDRYFTYIASFGAFTKASYSTAQNVKNALGHTAYVLSGISELSQIRDIHACVEVDGEQIEGDFLLGAVCNSTSVAGILTLDESVVDLQDGKFEVLLVRAPKTLAEVNECIRAIQNKTYDCTMLTFRSGAHITVTMEQPEDWTLDGEFQRGNPVVQFKNCNRALTLMIKEGTQ